MAGKKDHIVIAVMTGLEEDETGKIIRAIGHAKQQHAPHAKGRAVAGEESEVRGLLGKGTKKFLPWNGTSE